MKIQNFTVIVYKEDDMYIAECPEVGTVAVGLVEQGETQRTNRHPRDVGFHFSTQPTIEY